MRHFLKPRFTLLQLFFLVTAVPVCVGVVAAVEFTAWELSCELFGIDWHSDAKRFLIDDVGMSLTFVSFYATFAMLAAPAWLCYCIIAFVLGLLRDEWAFLAGLSFLASIALFDFLSDYLFGLHGHVFLRILSLFSMLLAAICFIAARRIRGSRTASPVAKANAFSTGVTVVAFAGIILVAAYGWWLIGLDREVSIKAQEIVEEIMEEYDVY